MILRTTGLADSNTANLYKVVTQLETRAVVEVQRRPGKRPLLRLVDR
jgi:hypothetical protein